MAMVMVMTIVMKMTLIDIHNHSLYQVDDGSQDINMSLLMLNQCIEQGISKVILTPHVNSSVTKANKEKHDQNFYELKQAAKNLNIDIYLGAEIYLSDNNYEIEFDKYTMNEKKVLLVEFSTMYETTIIELCHNLLIKGYSIIIAHVERYNYLSYEDLLELKNMGVYFQVNSSTILRKWNSKTLRKCKKMIKEGLIDFIASDMHNITNRKNNLKDAYRKIRKWFGKKKAKEIFNLNQEKLLFKNIT